MSFGHCMIALAGGTFYTGGTEPFRTRDTTHAYMDTRKALEAKLERCAGMPCFQGAKVIDLYDSLEVLNHLELSRICA